MKKRLILSIIGLFFIGIFLGAQIATSTTSVPPWTLNNPLPSSSDWVVTKFSNGTAYAVSGDGQSYTSSATNDSAVINYAFLNAYSATAKCKVTVLGNFTINAPVLYYPKSTYDLSGAYFKLADSANCRFFAPSATWSAQAEWTRASLEIYGGLYDGNMDNNAANSGTMYILGSGYNDIWIHDVAFKDVYGYAVNLTGVGEVNINNLRVYQDSGAHNSNGVYMTNVFDSTFSNMRMDCYGTDLYLSADARTNSFNNIYCGGGSPAMYFNGAYRNHFTNLWVQDCYDGGLYLVGASNYNTFVGGHFYSCSGAADNTYNGITVQGTSSYNVFSDFTYPDVTTTSTNKFSIQELESADYNLYTDMLCYVGGVKTLGAHSSYDKIYNVTGWVG